MAKVITTTLKIIGIALVIYLGIHIYMLFDRPYDTDTAMQYEFSDNVTFKGMFIRDESVMEYNVQGVKNYIVQDGQRVSNGSEVAKVYDYDYQLQNFLKADNIDTEIVNLKEAMEYKNQKGSDASIAISQVKNSHYDILDSISNNDYSDIQIAKQEFTLASNKVKITTGEESDFTARIDLLTNMRDTTYADRVASGAITAQSSGYFVSESDGCENNYTYDMLSAMSIDDLSVAVNTCMPIVNENSGKIVSEYTWHVYGVIDKNYLGLIEDIYKYKTNINIYIKSIASVVPVKIVDIKEESDNNFIGIMLEGDYISDEIMSLRSEEVSLVFGEYTGIRIDKDALRIVDGEKGVYIKYGNAVQFKRINPIFENDEYMLVPLSPTLQNSEGTVSSYDINEVNLYDEIITEGSGIYDGKIL